MQKSPNQSQTLAELKAGERALFIEIRAEKSVASRLTSLGFTPDVPVEMTQNYGRGPLMVDIRGTRVALGRHEAQSINVQKGGTK